MSSLQGSSGMSIPEIIRKKRDALELSEDEIKYFISRVIAPKDEGRIHDAQIGAFLMAAFLNGMSNAETTALVRNMAFSGFTFMWPVEWKGSVVDKHSTGGVGDKVSLPLAPALAACGLRVPMISGRGLDFTGGTLDKLESIPGFQVNLSKEGMTGILETVGCCIVGQTEDIVPADKILYAIRDTTSTVDNENLITASIISKKAAEGLDSLVLDVKTGRGAVMKKIEQSRSLAQKMVAAGSLFGMKMSAFITNMDAPLGRCIGNALEVAESIECLRGGGPDDLRELVLLFGGKLLESVGRVESLEVGKKLIADKLKDGSALGKFKEMMIGQGTEGTVAHELCHGDMWKYLPKATTVKTVTANASGYLWEIDALALGKYCHALGCGRMAPGSPVLYEPGIVLGKTIGDFIQMGDVLMQVHLPNGQAEEAYHLDTLIQYFIISTDKPPKYNLVLESIG